MDAGSRKLWFLVFSNLLLFTGLAGAQPIQTSPAPYPAAPFVAKGGHCGDGWDDGFGVRGVNGNVNSLLFMGSDLYVGGTFDMAGNVTASGIARWDGTTWYAVGAGLAGEFAGPQAVNAMTVLNGELYAGGAFTSLFSYVAKWDGLNWSALGTGVNGSVLDLIVHDGAIYATGEFTSAGGISASRIAKWDGTAWSPLGTGLNGSGYTLASWGGSLYVGGYFTMAGGVAVSNLARWDGTAWSAVPGAINGSISALSVSGNNLIAGGAFTAIDGANASHIASFDGSAWQPLDLGVNGNVAAITTEGSNIWVTGNFISASGTYTPSFAKWDGVAWTGPEEGLSGPGYSPTGSALTVGPGGKIFVGGNIASAGPHAAINVAAFDGVGWSALGDDNGIGGAPTNVVWTVAGRQTAEGTVQVFAGGEFLTAGGAVSKNIAMWDEATRTWSSLGGPSPLPNGRVRDIAIDGDIVYVGGAFNQVPGWSANFVAKWDGQAWGRLYTGVNSHVEALALCPNGTGGNDLYVGGNFTRAGGQPAVRIAKWDGSAWSALGSGMNNWVEDIAACPNGSGGYDIYAAGQFTTAGDVAANRVAKWDGTSWSPLGEGVDGPVDHMICIPDSNGGGTVYIAGNFTHSGNQLLNYVAKWDGTAWLPLGEGVNWMASGLATDGTNIYVGGNFTEAGGQPANFAAVWDGSTWAPLGGSAYSASLLGLSDLTFVGGSVYAGGLQDFAGCGVSFRFGRFTPATSTGVDIPDGSGRLLLGSATPNPFNPATTISFTMPVSGHAELAVYDIRGRKVASLVDGDVSAGDHALRFNANGLASGVYFARLSTAGTVETRKMVLLR